MKHQTPIRRAAFTCLLLCVVASTLGCRGLRPRYGLLLREDMSAELWKLPDEAGQGEADQSAVATTSDPNQEKTSEGGANIVATAASSGEITSNPDGSCSETSCATTACYPGEPCRRPFLMRCHRGGGFASEAEEAAAPPPALTPRFFPVPTQPVFTPRGDLSNLNPYAQQMMATSEVPPPCSSSTGNLVPNPTESPFMPQPVPQAPLPTRPHPGIVPAPVPDASGTNPTAPSLLPTASPSHWAFVPKASTPQDRDKAYALIATGSQLVK